MSLWKNVETVRASWTDPVALIESFERQDAAHVAAWFDLEPEERRELLRHSHRRAQWPRTIAEALAYTAYEWIGGADKRVEDAYRLFDELIELPEDTFANCWVNALWAVMLHFAGELAPERLLRSEDGGETWTSPLALPQIGGVVATEGAVLAGSRLGGLYRSEDGGTFEALDPALPVTCLAALGGELWACTDRAVAGFGLARVVDGAVEPALALSEIVDPVACPRCSTAGVVCPAWAPDVAYDLGQDASVPPGFGDGGTGAPRDAEIPAECRPPGPPGCACGVGAGETPSWPLGLIFVAWILRRVTQK